MVRGIPRRGVLALVAALALLPLLTGGALVLETYDPFCAACHTEPETTFVARRLQDPSPDLAAWHAAEEAVACIRCHTGPGVGGRLEGLALGSRDLVRWLAGRARQPARLSQPYPDLFCTQCHAAVLEEEGFERHFHNRLPDPGHTVRCVDCHPAHVEGFEEDAFLDPTLYEPACFRCHEELGKGPRGGGAFPRP